MKIGRLSRPAWLVIFAATVIFPNCFGLSEVSVQMNNTAVLNLTDSRSDSVVDRLFEKEFGEDEDQRSTGADADSGSFNSSVNDKQAVSLFPQQIISRSGGRRNKVSDEGYDRLSRKLLEEHRISDDLAKGYMTNSELETAVNVFCRRCSNISRTYSIGNSVEGVPLWVMEISDRPGVDEPKPAFKFIGNVHGDEPVGRELLLLLVNWLCDNYLKDPLATFVIQNVHLHILPSMNPDGFNLRIRNNANNIDLNRDFPDQFFPMNDDETSRQPETRAIMKWLREIPFTASASLHGGALVANYPWDGTEDKRKYYFPCPDDETFRFLASVYSHSHYNMSSSKEFEGGVTNGASWYPIYGGMQDWNYIHAGCFELTLELTDNKWPSSSELPTIWEYNRMSMLNLVASVAKAGVHGRIFSSTDGRPLPASVTFLGINYSIQANKQFADYHRLIAPGHQYEVEVAMPGYKSKRTTIIVQEKATSLDFILDPEVPSAENSKRLVTIDCSYERSNQINVLGSLGMTNLQVSVVLLVVLAFLCLTKRGALLGFVKRRQSSTGSKRSVAV